MKRLGWLGAAAFGAAAVAVVPCAAKADVVLLSGSTVRADVDDGAGFFDSRGVNITGFGTGPNPAVAGGGNYSAVAYDLSATGFKIDFAQTRTGTYRSGAITYGSIDFRATDATTTYAMAGAFTFTNPYGELDVTLYDLTTNTRLDDRHSTNNGPGSTYTKLTVGGTGGQFNFTSPGVLSGLLDPTHHYRWGYAAMIQAYPFADGGASGSGSITLTFGQAADAATPLPAAAPAALALLGGMGLRRRARRPVAAE